MAFTKPGLARPVIIPRKKDLKEDIVLGVARTLGISKKQMLEKLTRIKKSTKHD